MRRIGTRREEGKGQVRLTRQLVGNPCHDVNGVRDNQDDGVGTVLHDLGDDLLKDFYVPLHQTEP